MWDPCVAPASAVAAAAEAAAHVVDDNAVDRSAAGGDRPARLPCANGEATVATAIADATPSGIALAMAVPPTTLQLLAGDEDQ